MLWQIPGIVLVVPFACNFVQTSWRLGVVIQEPPFLLMFNCSKYLRFHIPFTDSKIVGILTIFAQQEYARCAIHDPKVKFNGRIRAARPSHKETGFVSSLISQLRECE